MLDYTAFAIRQCAFRRGEISKKLAFPLARGTKAYAPALIGNYHFLNGQYAFSSRVFASIKQ